MRIKKQIISILLVLFISLFNINSVNAAFSKDCKKHLGKEFLSGYLESIPNELDFKLVDDKGLSPLVIKRDGAEDVKIDKVVLLRKNHFRIYAIKIIWDGEIITHCLNNDHFTLTAVLVEKHTHYNSATMTEIKTRRVSMHFHEGCGSPCYFSRVDVAYFGSDAPPNVRNEIKSDIYDYPNKWFTGYLTLQEVTKFMISEDFQEFEWSGRIYKTEKLIKKFKLK